MKPSVIFGLVLTMVTAWTGAAFAAGSAGPVPAPVTAPIPAPEDKPYPGVISLSIDASDIDRKIVRVRETIPVTGGPLILLYPQWVPGGHAPENPIDRLSGLSVSAGGKPAAWTRDVVNVFAFHVDPPKGADSIEVEFQYLSPVRDAVGASEITSRMMVLPLIQSVLYPAGYYARQIPVQADVALPEGWSYGTALDGATTAGAKVSFKPTNLETLVDSPIYAGRFVAKVDLDPGAAAPVRLDVFADRPDELEIKPQVLAVHRALVQQALKLFGSHHYDHYDFLFSVSDDLEQLGLEHDRSSEDGADGNYFTDYDRTPADRDLLAHEFTHSWNGKFRRPQDLWTPNYNVPMRDSLLWVYEGQTQYWGYVLTGRSGLWTKQQTLDQLAMVAAYFDLQPGRRWRPLQDTTSDEIINPRRPASWSSWQRFEDYYTEGALIWLDVDTLIREQSHGQKSLDDFARAFFGVDDGSTVINTYTFDDVVAALNAVQPYDWARFLRERLDGAARPAPLDGIKRGGYRLVFTDKPNDLAQSAESKGKYTDLTYSLGAQIGTDGTLKSVLWDSAAFKSGLTAGMKVLAVNGDPYEADLFKTVIKAAKGTSTPIELIVRTTDRFKVIRVDYHGGLRYPHLERDASQPARLDDILAARK